MYFNEYFHFFSRHFFYVRALLRTIFLIDNIISTKIVTFDFRYFSIQTSHQYQQGQATSDLKSEMASLKQQHDGALNEIRVKEERINQLIREIHNLVNEQA